MRRHTIEWVIILAIFLLVLVLAVLGLQQQDRRITPEVETDLEFSGAEGAYLRAHDQVRIYVEEDLQFLMTESRQTRDVREDPKDRSSGGSYLESYLNILLQPAGLKVQLLTGAKGADCSLRVVTDSLRRQSGSVQFTSPLFQVDGRLFVVSAQRLERPLNVCLQEGRLSEDKIEKLTYQGRDLQLVDEAPVSAMADGAGQKAWKGIVGDRSAVGQMLRDRGLQGEYTETEKSLYQYNACILVDEGEADLYGILNKCIHGIDRHDLTYEMSQRWTDGCGPIYMERSIGNGYLPILIVILSVLIAFFVYYIANRGMYQELGTRMDQITASRNEMQTTFQGVGHYMAEMTPSGEITDLNQAFAQGISSRALNRRVWDVLDLSPQAREELQEMVRLAAEGKQPDRLETSIGRSVFVIDVFPVEDARRQVGQLLFMAIDVTQERMAKRQMLQDNKMIAIGQLAAGIAHEIRNPLGIIRNYCYVLKTMEDEEIRARAIEEIEKAVEVSGSIINDLLDFSRISPERRAMIDVEDHIRSILSLNESAFRQKNIRLTIRCPQRICTWMALEPFDMILLNLVTNAMDAIEAGGEESGEEGRITVSIHMEGEDGERFTVTVEDNGEGISEEALDEIFNPFYTTKGSKGTGLGLYIVYNELEKLEGEIQVSSQVGKGTVFRVSLPLSREEEENVRCPENI